jgi:hypothetical protein
MLSEKQEPRKKRGSAGWMRRCGGRGATGTMVRNGMSKEEEVMDDEDDEERLLLLLLKGWGGNWDGGPMNVGCGTVRWHRDADEDDEAKRRSCGTRRQRCRVAWRCGMQAAMSIRLGVWCRVGDDDYDADDLRSKTAPCWLGCGRAAAARYPSRRADPPPVDGGGGCVVVWVCECGMDSQKPSPLLPRL